MSKIVFSTAAFVAAVLSLIGGSVCADPVTLPVEVLYPEKSVKTVTLPVPQTGAAVALEVRAQGIEWGGIGGPLDNLTLAIAIKSPAGPLPVSFRFNQSNSVNSGFRIIGINFLDASGKELLPPSAFVWDDPATWKAPMPDAASVAAGKTLYTTATLNASPMNPSKLHVTCAGCHTSDGRDLAYFSFSNASIIARSQFHGLTATQGAQIASYIRSLPIAPIGRPWNPPYQPGPGADSRPVAAWAAGMGIDAVLPSDSGMLPYLFPRGISAAAITTSGHLDLRELPISLPLPTWNQWLPKVAPIDAFGMDANFQAIEAATEALDAKLEADPVGVYTSGAYARGLGNIGNGPGRAFSLAHTGPGTIWTPEYSEQLYSLHKSRLVHVWEQMQKYGLEGMTQKRFGSGSQVEPRSWDMPQLFSTAPKAIHIPEDTSGIGGSSLYEHYFTDAWYYLQLLLDPGNGHRVGNQPVDWGYLYGVTYNTAKMTNRSEALRLIAQMVKGSQESNVAPPNKADSGWNPGRVDPVYQFGGTSQALWKGVDTTERSAIVDAMVAAWLAANEEYTPAQYYTDGYEAADQVPAAHIVPDGNATRLVDRVWWMIPKLRAEGVDGNLLNAVCDWAASIWPQADWKSLKQ